LFGNLLGKALGTSFGRSFGKPIFRHWSHPLVATVLALWVSASLSGVAFAEDMAGEQAAPDLALGEQRFALCTQCHGPNGGGNSDALAPAIAGMPVWYVEAQLNNFRKGVRGLHHQDVGGLRMYPMSLWLAGDADVKAVSAYVASLPKVDPADELPDEGDAAKGQGYYAVCSACHGADAGGNPLMGAPPLAGMSDWYLYSSIQKYKSGVRGNGPGDPYGPAMIGMVATLPNDEAVLDVIAHIQSLEKQ
jgi:cytochrome c553